MDSVGGGPAAQGPWYLTTGQRFIGTLAGGAALVFGLIGAILSPLSPICLFGGILVMADGVALLACEAPLLVRFFSALNGLAGFWENRPQFYKVMFYAVLGIVPLFFCTGFNVVLGCACILVTAALYGVAAVGRRGSAASGAGANNQAFHGQPYTDVDKSGLVESQMYSQTTMR